MDHTTKLPTSSFANEEKTWTSQDLWTFFKEQKIYILLCTVISFLNDYCHLHGVPKKIRVDNGSCFLSYDFKTFCEKYNIEIIYSTVGDHRSNGLVERLVFTVKSNLLTKSFDLPKPSLNSLIEKLVVLRSRNILIERLTPDAKI